MDLVLPGLGDKDLGLPGLGDRDLGLLPVFFIFPLLGDPLIEVLAESPLLIAPKKLERGRSKDMERFTIGRIGDNDLRRLPMVVFFSLGLLQERPFGEAVRSSGAIVVGIGFMGVVLVVWHI